MYSIPLNTIVEKEISMTIFKSVSELVPGDKMIGFVTENRLEVSNVEKSSAMPGMIAVENEYGTLYLDPEERVEVEPRR